MIPAGVSCSVLSDGILRVGATLRRCWRRGMAERIIPDDRSIKCVAVRCRPGLMLSCLLWFSTSSEALPFLSRGWELKALRALPFIKGWGCHTSLGPVSSLNQGFMLYSSASRFQNWVTWNCHVTETGEISLCQCFIMSHTWVTWRRTSSFLSSRSLYHIPKHWIQPPVAEKNIACSCPLSLHW